MKKLSTTESITLVELRTNLGEYISQIDHQDERVVVSRYGKPIAAIISITDLETLERAETGEDVTVLDGGDGTGDDTADDDKGNGGVSEDGEGRDTSDGEGAPGDANSDDTGGEGDTSGGDRPDVTPSEDNPDEGEDDLGDTTEGDIPDVTSDEVSGEVKDVEVQDDVTRARVEVVEARDHDGSGPDEATHGKDLGMDDDPVWVKKISKSVPLSLDSFRKTLHRGRRRFFG